MSAAEPLQPDRALAFPEPDGQATLLSRFQEVVRSLPAHLAAVDGRAALSYAELDRQSDRLAGYLAAVLGSQPQPVALLLQPGVNLPASMLGVLKSGKFYTPLEPAAGVDALRLVLQDSTASLLLAEAGTLALAREIAGESVRVAAVESLLLNDSPGLPPAAVGPSDLNDPQGSPPAAPGALPGDARPAAVSARSYAAIYYTSGSTGQPKGVLYDHAMLLQRSWLYAHHEGFGPHDRVAHLFSVAFTASAAILHASLMNGATLCFGALPEIGLAGLFDWLEQQRITVFYPLAHWLRELPQHAGDRRLPATLRIVFTSGQTIYGREAGWLLQRCPPGCQVVNRLGGSETGLVARHVIAAHDLERADDPVAIGWPCAGNELFLLDQDGNPAPAGEPGQIAVRSRYLSPGYWRQPDLTAARFLASPDDPQLRTFLSGDWGRLRSDGELVFQGRHDFMVKIRGYRVELEAVEAALLSHPDVRACAAAVSPGRDGENRLAAYIVPRQLPAPTTSELRQWAARSLPAYMLPARFIWLEAFPYTPTGKIDRRALPPPGRQRPELAAGWAPPRTPLEQQLADLWAGRLDLDEVGINDNFFELGGDSLSAMHMLLEVEQLTGVPVPQQVVRDLTIARLAQMGQPGGAADPPAVPAAPAAALKRPPGAKLKGLLAGEYPPQELLFWSIRRSLSLFSYSQGVRWLAWLGGPPQAGWLFRAERQRFETLAQELAAPPPTAGAFCASVVGNLVWDSFQNTWSGVQLPPGGFVELLQAAPQRFWRSFAAGIAAAGSAGLARFSGLERLEAARQPGRGVILLTYHSPATPLASLALAHRLGLGQITTISQVKAGKLASRAAPLAPADVEGLAASWAALFALQGERILRQGGIVQIVNDVSYASGAYQSKTLGRREYALKTGFAELALTSEATLLPVRSGMDAGGRIHLEILPALTPQPGSSLHAGRVSDLLDQYVAFLESSWRAWPESIGWGALRRYCAQPPSNQRR